MLRRHFRVLMELAFRCPRATRVVPSVPGHFRRPGAWTPIPVPGALTSLHGERPLGYRGIWMRGTVLAPVRPRDGLAAAQAKLLGRAMVLRWAPDGDSTPPPDDGLRCRGLGVFVESARERDSLAVLRTHREGPGRVLITVFRPCPGAATRAVEVAGVDRSPAVTARPRTRWDIVRRRSHW